MAHPEFVDLIKDLTDGLESRDHPNPKLAARGWKEWKYIKKSKDSVIEIQKDTVAVRDSGTLTQKQSEALMDNLHGDGGDDPGSSSAAITVAAKKPDVELKENMKVFASAEKQFASLKTDAVKLLATLKHALVAQPLLQTEVTKMQDVMTAFVLIHDKLIDRSAACAILDPMDCTMPIILSQNNDLIKELVAAADVMKNAIRDGKKWLPTRNSSSVEAAK